MRLDWMVHYDLPEGSTTYPIDDPPEPRSIRDLAEEQRKLALLPLYAEIPQLADRSKELPQRRLRTCCWTACRRCSSC